MHKYIKNGQVAVVVSNNYGAGWSTWAKSEQSQQALFDPAIVDYILGNSFDQLEQYITIKYPDRIGYRVTSLQVCWIPQGTEFRIQEYDGRESIELKQNIKWFIA